MKHIKNKLRGTCRWKKIEKNPQTIIRVYEKKTPKWHNSFQVCLCLETPFPFISFCALDDLLTHTKNNYWKTFYTILSKVLMILCIVLLFSFNIYPYNKDFARYWQFCISAISLTITFSRAKFVDKYLDILWCDYILILNNCRTVDIASHNLDICTGYSSQNHNTLQHILNIHVYIDM